jgi:hypothetical protein
MRLQEHMEKLNEITSNTQEVAGWMARLIMADKDMATKKLSSLLPLKQATFEPGKEWNDAFGTLVGDIERAIKKALKAAK